MQIELDLQKINLEAKRKEKENLRFRSDLKNSDMEPEQIDNIVHKVYNEVAEQIDCTKCANCCNVMRPMLSDEDVRNFVSSLEIEEEDFRKEYLIKSDDPDDDKVYEFNSLPCPFLKDNKCSNYNNRPENCRSYPFLHKPDFESRLYGVIDNYAVCPIVYNVFEELKKIFRRNR